MVGHHEGSIGVHLVDLERFVEFDHLEQEASGGFRLRKEKAGKRTSSSQQLSTRGSLAS